MPILQWRGSSICTPMKRRWGLQMRQVGIRPGNNGNNVNADTAIRTGAHLQECGELWRSAERGGGVVGDAFVIILSIVSCITFSGHGGGAELLLIPLAPPVG
ncbi:hypothetical protein PG984_012985 [Apiospora sp. TS-2023a]